MYEAHLRAPLAQKRLEGVFERVLRDIDAYQIAARSGHSIYGLQICLAIVELAQIAEIVVIAP
jgi:hypothetical protein